jgi:hypothetical protein
MSQSDDIIHPNEEHPVLKPEQQLMAAKAHNSTVYICRLPTELLIATLNMLRFEPINADFVADVISFVLYEKSWMRSTWVCSYIRSVAINTPELWTRISPIHSLEWNALTASRALNTPLSVDVHPFYYPPNDERLVERMRTLVTTYLPRAGYAGLHFRDARDEQMELLPSPIANLTSLYVNHLEGPLAKWIAPSIAPNLVSLSVSFANVETWPNLLWRKLRHLTLESSRMSSEYISVLLVGTVHLELLCIKSMQRNFEPKLEAKSYRAVTSPHDRLRPLNNLPIIRIFDHPVVILAILTSISILGPLDHLCLELTCAIKSDRDDNILPLLDLLFAEGEDTRIQARPVPSASLFAKGSWTFDLLLIEWNLDSQSGRGSVLRIPYRNEHHQVYQKYDIRIQHLEVNNIKASVDRVPMLDELIPQPCMELEQTLFRTTHMAPPLLMWIDHLQLNRPSLEVLYDQGQG